MLRNFIFIKVFPVCMFYMFFIFHSMTYVEKKITFQCFSILTIWHNFGVDLQKRTSKIFFLVFYFYAETSELNVSQEFESYAHKEKIITFSEKV